jgi:hypothetical protein
VSAIEQRAAEAAETLHGPPSERQEHEAGDEEEEEEALLHGLESRWWGCAFRRRRG